MSLVTAQIHMWPDEADDTGSVVIKFLARALC